MPQFFLHPLCCACIVPVFICPSLYCRLPLPPVQAMELNPLAAQNADLSHDYEDIRKYSAVSPPSAKGPAAGYDCNVVHCNEATAPVGKSATSDGNYDVINPFGGAIANSVPMMLQGQRSVKPLEPEEASIYTDIKSE